MSDDDTAAEARRGREAAEAASTARAKADAEARDEQPASVTEHAGEPAPAGGKRGRAAASSDDDGPPSYSMERLVNESSAFLGCEPHVAAGALHAAGSKEMTVKDAKAAVKAWLKSEVAPDPATVAEEV